MNENIKKIIIGGMITSTVLSNTVIISNANEVENINNTEIVIRTGEYPNKPGKRLIVDKDFNIDCPVRYDESRDQYFIGEYDMNLKVAQAVVRYLESKGVNVKLQNTQSKSEDLNSAGKIAKQSNPKIYLSIHHNSFKDTSSGYFFMANKGDTKSSIVAKNLSNAMTNNPMLIPQMSNRANDGYIGELNQKPGDINILAELGFFSNPEEVKKCVDNGQIDFIAERIGNELIEVLDGMND